MDFQFLRDKIEFFRELDALNEPIDDEDDRLNKEEEEFRAKIRAIFPPRSQSIQAPSQLFQSFTTGEKTPNHPLRSFSAPTPRPATSQSSIVIKGTPDSRIPTAPATATRQFPTSTASLIIEETPLPAFSRPPSLLRSATVPIPCVSPPIGVERSPSMASGMRKRKRQPRAVETVPESDQVLKNLSFYYIPNDDIAPARKLRIRKAQTYGAQWVRELAKANHVIVDNRLTFKDIEKILSLSGVALAFTNENYTIDCITHRMLLNPDQPRYRVSGFPILAVNSQPKSSRVEQQSIEPSLQLKAALTVPGRSIPACRADTRPRSSESSPQKEKIEVSCTQAVDQAAEDNGNSQRDAEPSQSRLSDSIRAEESISRPPPSTQPGIQDELSEYIELMLQYKDLPLDEEDDDDAQSVKSTDATPASETESGSEDDGARKRRVSSRVKKKTIAFADRFACNRGGTLDKSDFDLNPNSRTIEILQSMCDYYTRINDHWRTIAYRKAINTLKQQSTKISTEEEACCLPNVGRRIAAKIEEIVTTNALKRLEYAHDEPLDQALSTFLGVYGVGNSIARRWLAQGYRTLDDLRANANLTPNQRVGIDHYNDLNSRIPRPEVTALGAYVSREAKAIDPAVELLVGGSYRRGSSFSGDIDFIVTKRGTTSVSDDLVAFLEELIRVLTAKGFIVATLAGLHSTRRPSKEGPGSKWHGCCVLPPSEYNQPGITAREKPIWRRIDFLLVPESEYGAALIYFTGNDIFNRSMRLLASRKGMRLNQRGLYKDVMRGRRGGKLFEGELVEGRDEKRIFELLGVNWRAPEERWC